MVGSVSGIELLQSSKETLNVLRRPRVNDIDILSHEGSALDDTGQPTDENEIDALVNEDLQAKKLRSVVYENASRQPEIYAACAGPRCGGEAARPASSA